MKPQFIVWKKYTTFRVVDEVLDNGDFIERKLTRQPGDTDEVLMEHLPTIKDPFIHFMVLKTCALSVDKENYDIIN